MDINRHCFRREIDSLGKHAPGGNFEEANAFGQFGGGRDELVVRPDDRRMNFAGEHHRHSGRLPFGGVPDDDRAVGSGGNKELAVEAEPLQHHHVAISVEFDAVLDL